MRVYNDEVSFMKKLELTEAKARQINELLQFAINKGFNDPFSISYYETKSNSGLDKIYLQHLVSVIKQYNDSPSLLYIDGFTIACNSNTEQFLKDGGFIRIFEKEQEEALIQKMTLTSLKQSVLGTKEWYKLIGVTIIVTIVTTILTTWVNNREQDKKSNSENMTEQSKRTISNSDSVKITKARK